MARSCGIRFGQRHASLVLLEGSAKKPKLRAHLEVEVAPGEEDALGSLADALKAAAKGQKIKVTDEHVQLALDSGLAAFRPLSLPFADKAKVEEVLKFEIESRLPQWDIDEVVCDFHVRRSTPVESDLLVIALKKADVKARIDASARAGFEPHEVEIVATTLFEAARHAGLLAADAAQLLVHIGERTSTLVVVEGGRLASMRALQLGLGAAASSAEADPAAEGETAAEAPIAAANDPERQKVVAERLTREILRTLSAGQREHAIAAVYLCGTEMADLVAFDNEGNASGPHVEIAGVPIAPLDALRESAPELSLAERLRLVPAFGAALHGLGANGLTPHLRREELRYAGKFERLEVPLGVLGLFLLTLTTALYIVDYKVVEAREADLDAWTKSNHNYLIGSTNDGTRGRLPLAPDNIKNYSRRIAEGPDSDPDRTQVERLRHLRSLMAIEIGRLERELGTKTDIAPPQSALEAMTHTLDVIHGMGEKLGRFAIREVRAQQNPGTASGGEHVQVVLNMTFWGDLEATRAYNDMMNELEGQPWADRVERRGTNTLEGGGGIFVDGITIYVDTNRIPKEQL